MTSHGESTEICLGLNIRYLNMYCHSYLKRWKK